MPPKGFFIDKALGSVGSAVEEKLLMEKLAMGDVPGLVRGDDSSEEVVGEPRPGLGEGQEYPKWPRVNRLRTEARLSCSQEPGGREQVAKPETSALENRFLETESFLIS